MVGTFVIFLFAILCAIVLYFIVISPFFENRPKLGLDSFGDNYIINSKYSAFASSYAISKNKWQILKYYPVYDYKYGLRFNIIDFIKYRIFYNKFKNKTKHNQEMERQKDNLKHQLSFIESLQKDISDFERKNVEEIKSKYNNIWDNRELILKTKHPVKLYSPEEFEKINWFNKMHNIGDIVGAHHGNYIDFYKITEYEGKESYLRFLSRSEFTCFKVC